jgi:hypothetical protein
MEAMAQAAADARDVEDAMRIGSVGMDDVDDVDLEKELEVLVESDRAKTIEEEGRLEKLAGVPVEAVGPVGLLEEKALGDSGKVAVFSQ